MGEVIKYDERVHCITGRLVQQHGNATSEVRLLNSEGNEEDKDENKKPIAF